MRAPGPPQKAIDGTFDMIQKTIVIQLNSGRAVTLEIGQKYGNGGAWARLKNQPSQAWVLSRSLLELFNLDGHRLIKP